METWCQFNQIICKHLSDKEEVVQKTFEQLFSELFGYSKLFGEIDSHRVIHLGSSDRVIPDIIIRDSKAKKDLFLIELKQLNMPRTDKYEEQLIGYMKQLSLTVGMLICDHIYVYYLDLSTGKHICSQIAFGEDNPAGKKFIDLFRKGSFSNELIKEFLQQEKEFESNVKKIKDELLDLDIKKLVSKHFLTDFSAEEVRIALYDIEFVIKDSTIIVSTGNGGTNTGNTNTGGTGKGTSTGSTDTVLLHEEKIQNWVKRIFTYLLSHKVLTDTEIFHLHDKEYSKKTFGVNYPILVDKVSDIKDATNHVRYWKKPICGFYICSQWWLDHDSEYDINIRSWLAKMLPDYKKHNLERK